MVFDKLEAAGFPGWYKQLAVFMGSSSISGHGDLLPPGSMWGSSQGFSLSVQPSLKAEAVMKGGKMSTGCKGPLGSAGYEVSPHAACCIFQVLKMHLGTCCLKTQELVLQVDLVKLFIRSL